MDDFAIGLHENWMNNLYQIALMNIGEERMQCESWYYTSKSIWYTMYMQGYTPDEAYEEDCTL